MRANTSLPPGVRRGLLAARVLSPIAVLYTPLLYAWEPTAGPKSPPKMIAELRGYPERRVALVAVALKPPVLSTGFEGLLIVVNDWTAPGYQPKFTPTPAELSPPPPMAIPARTEVDELIRRL